MTKKELVKIIREVVKIEVKKQVNEIFINEEKSTSLKSLTEKEFKEPIRKKYKKREKVTYTSNSTLNDILNETVGGIEGNGEMDEYPTMGGGTFDTSRASELLGYSDTNFGGDKQTQREVGAVQTMKEAGVTANQVPDHVQDALTKDYSKLMKHDKMKSNR
jgi:hypothetical protein